MNGVLKQLIVSCDPYIFFSALRIFLGSYKDGKGRSNGNSVSFIIFIICLGLIFEGVAEFEDKPQNLIGASGAQSSILPAVDAFLGIKYDNNPILDRIVHGMFTYMPKKHAKFCKSITVGCLRSYIEAFEPEERGFSQLRQLYDQLIDEIVRFRKEVCLLVYYH